ncbi:AMP-binding protein [Pollutimonas subterranea]|uniref:AMP-binding protein n=1 Tax=Pollutimonas subterranea TaxID=2045210 RepID=A0A2N4U9T3_9BURK|nr:AMP-binding protein [Pollutimonas subterranea]PLC51759.1 AMP-binding protein [Pollutimonas subterranea]
MNDQYSVLYPTYQWFVPSQFNIAQACVHRWAENPQEGRRIAIYHENEVGQREVWTYSRLSETTNKLSHGLVKMGVQPGARVAVIMDQRPEAVAACMAVFSVGAIAVPLPALIGSDGLAARLRDADARVAIVDATAAPALLDAQLQCPALAQIIALGFDHEAIIPWRTLLARQPADFKVAATKSDAAALLLYTGGTAGAPKGVLLAHGSLIGSLPGFVAAQNWFPQKGDVFWSPIEWSRAAGFMNALLPSLYFGQSLVGTLGDFSTTRCLEVMERYRVTNAFLFPTIIKLIMHDLPAPRDRYQLALRAIMTTGESLDAGVFEWCRKALGVTPNEVFGQTEMNAVIGNSHKKWPAKPGSIGRPYPGHQVAVLDSHGKPCAVGTVGEIALNRYDIHRHPDPALFLGYWRNEAATQGKFSKDWCLTGDLASVDEDGYFWYAGRSDDIFKSSGHRIGPGEIEDCLLGHSAVSSAAVVPKPDNSRGALVKAYVVLRNSAKGLNTQDLQKELQEHVRTHLASYQTPREIEFVDSLPLTNTGNIRRHILRAREQQRSGAVDGSRK